MSSQRHWAQLLFGFIGFGWEHIDPRGEEVRCIDVLRQAVLPVGGWVDDGSISPDSSSEIDVCCEDVGDVKTHVSLLYKHLQCLLRRHDALASLVHRLHQTLPEPKAPLASAIADAEAVFAEAARQHATFERDGFVILRSALSSELVESARHSFEFAIWNPDRQQRPSCLVEITRSGAFATNISLQLPTTSARVRRRSYRILGMETGPEEPKAGPWNRIFYNPRILEAVTRLLGGPPILVQSLVFERGSEQSLHDDTWYLPGVDTPGGVVGVWVALDNTDWDNGPLFYVPGSHRRPEEILNPMGKTRGERVRLPSGAQTPSEIQDRVLKQAKEEIQHAGLQQEIFFARAGDVGIWHEHLLHGGLAVRDHQRTRLSLVIHYTCEV